MYELLGAAIVNVSQAKYLLPLAIGTLVGVVGGACLIVDPEAAHSAAPAAAADLDLEGRRKLRDALKAWRVEGSCHLCGGNRCHTRQHENRKGGEAEEPSSRSERM